MMFNKEIMKRVWGKALPLLNDDPNRVRKDKCGAWIVFDEYGNRNSQFGWEIDHIIPISKGGTDEIETFSPYNGKIMLLKVMSVLIFVK